MSQEKNILPYVEDDGGRSRYFRAKGVRDCVCRAITIASGRDYLEIYNALRELTKKSRASRKGSPRSGIFTQRAPFKRMMKELGFTWTPCCSIGQKESSHLYSDEMPLTGRHVCSAHRHYVALIDGVVHDTWDSRYDRFGQARRIYGYWTYNN